MPKASIEGFRPRPGALIVAAPTLEPEIPPRFVEEWTIGFHLWGNKLWHVRRYRAWPSRAWRRDYLPREIEPALLVGAVYALAAILLVLL